jgi:hypothetical protein
VEVRRGHDALYRLREVVDGQSGRLPAGGECELKMNVFEVEEGATLERNGRGRHQLVRERRGGDEATQLWEEETAHDSTCHSGVGASVCWRRKMTRLAGPSGLEQGPKAAAAVGPASEEDGLETAGPTWK